MIQKISDGKTLIAIMGSVDDMAWGNNFITESELPMQIGVLKSNKTVIQNHVHKIRNRQFKTISNECHIVLRGKVCVRFYNYDKEIVELKILRQNMFCVLYNGGHGFEVLKDNTLMMEIKLGSFTSIDDDKEKF